MHHVKVLSDLDIRFCAKLTLSFHDQIEKFHVKVYRKIFFFCHVQILNPKFKVSRKIENSSKSYILYSVLWESFIRVEHTVCE